MQRRMTRREGDPGQVPGAKPGSVADVVRPGSLAWASAVGNHAVQRLARQPAGPDELGAEEPAEGGAEAQTPEAEVEAPPAELGALEGAGIGHESLAGLAALDQLGEDALPE